MYYIWYVGNRCKHFRTSCCQKRRVKWPNCPKEKKTRSVLRANNNNMMFDSFRRNLRAWWGKYCILHFFPFLGGGVVCLFTGLLFFKTFLWQQQQFFPSLSSGYQIVDSSTMTTQKKSFEIVKFAILTGYITHSEYSNWIFDTSCGLPHHKIWEFGKEV